MNNGARWMRLFRESFVPVIIVILGIFLILLYVQFRAEYDADKVTVIDIQPVAASISESETADVRSDSEPIVSGGPDSEQQRAGALLAPGKRSGAQPRGARRLSRAAGRAARPFRGAVQPGDPADQAGRQSGRCDSAGKGCAD